MTDKEKDKRIFDIVYSTDSRTELAEQIVDLEEHQHQTKTVSTRARMLVNGAFFAAGISFGYAVHARLERDIPYSYRQTIPDIVSYIFTGDLA